MEQKNLSQYDHCCTYGRENSNSTGVVVQLNVYWSFRSVPVAARSKAWVYGRSSAGIVGSDPTMGMDVCLL